MLTYIEPNVGDIQFQIKNLKFLVALQLAPAQLMDPMFFCCCRCCLQFRPKSSLVIPQGPTSATAAAGTEGFL